MQFLDIHEPGQTPMPHADEALAVGIDLGTTNSLVAIARDGQPEVLRDDRGRGIVPSVVAYAEDGKIAVGESARQQVLDRPEAIVSSIKRLMGRGVEDVKALAGTLPFAIEPGEGMVRLSVAGRKMTPVEISADILRALKARAEAKLDRGVESAVVTVPAYFDDAARTATKDAARLAGLNVLRLVNEPTAAALAYGLDEGAEGIYAVYDLGGGTFDISILRMEKGVFQVLATGGDAALGGDDFDHAIAERFLAERAQRGAEGPLSVADAKLAMATARLAKECLTERTQGDFVLAFDQGPSSHHLDVGTMESLIAPLVDRTVAICAEVLADAGLTPDEIKGVVLVGGSTRVPLVRRRVSDFFTREPLGHIDPDEVVALGAALQAEALTVGGDTLLLDVIPLSLGIETMGKLVEKVIPRNSPIPTARAQEFTTYQDGQTAMMVHVVQGEREMVDQNRSLARFELHGIPPMTAGAARITVTFSVDADGLLTVSAREKTTGVEQQIAVKPSYGLTEEEMATMLKDSMEYAVEDMAARLLAEARVEAERNLLALRAALEADGELLDAAERAEIDQAIAAVEAAVAGEDRGAIHSAGEGLEKASRGFAERRMDKGIRAALRGQSVGDVADKISDGSQG